MAMTLIAEHSIGEGVLGAIERIYRADNGYGLIVVTDPPGSEDAGRMTVTPVRFESERPDSYLVLSKSKTPHEGPDDGAPTEPRRLYEDDDLDRLFARIAALEPYEDRHADL